MEYKVVELKNKEGLEEFEEYLTKYDWYAIDDLKDLKNKVNRKIFHLQQEGKYIVVTGKDLKKTILKKMRKDKRFEVTKNDFTERKGFRNYDGES
jgi:chromosomal replication initiation ATPase DnaA